MSITKEQADNINSNVVTVNRFSSLAALPRFAKILLAGAGVVILALFCLIIINTVTSLSNLHSNTTAVITGKNITFTGKMTPALPLTGLQLQARQHGTWKTVASTKQLHGSQFALTAKALGGKVAYRIVPTFIGIPGHASTSTTVTGALAVLHVHITGIPAGKQAQVFAFSQNNGRQTIAKDTVIPVVKADNWSFVTTAIPLDKGALEWSKTPNTYISVKAGSDQTVTLSYDLYLDAAAANQLNAAVASDNLQAIPQFYKAYGITISSPQL